MARTTTAISVRAEPEFPTWMYVLAKDLGKPVADVVREAIDAKHGERLAEIAAAFHASRGNKSIQRKRK